MEDESDRAATDSSQNFEGGGHFTTKLRDGNPVQADPLPTLTVPCHHIRLGDFLILQGRPCQVIKISTSAATGQYRYLGVDLFTKKLHEAVSVTSYPAPSVVVQTMLSPVFKQYRVVDLADGHVTAMTEAGDVKQRLPVIDQSNVWSRLKQAFESGRGSVRVIVLSTMENGDLAVDVKVIYGSSLAERQPGQPGFDLHALARDGDLWMLQDALETKPNINKLDSYGRSALFYAVENRHIKTVFALLDAEANLNIVDSSGKTALDLAVRLAGSDRDMVAVAEMFLRRGALPMEAINPQVLGLLSASARGDSAIVAHILRQNPPINDTDRLGYTALHEAACFGRIKQISQRESPLEMTGFYMRWSKGASIVASWATIGRILQTSAKIT
ncbi:woronin body major protein [Colletotrichum tofieldiae]|nr:woronin body major protein [Colletotrichum tofieldiae]